MTDAVASTSDARSTRAGFVLAVLLSASLVFTVQPLVARLLLPVLGGAPAVWNVSLAFFQGALLLGYGYAHLLQRLKSLRSQAIVHMAALVLAAVVLPLRVEHGLSDPPSGEPILWLVAELALTVGAPFAALSATAPLLQAWFARTQPGRNPYALYVASNAGSLAALLAYPLIIEPLMPLGEQRWAWTFGYAAFVLLAAGLSLRLRDAGALETPAVRAAPPVSWGRRIAWLLLAAAPSSLLLGVTTHLATDVASAPFLWIPPLALYLLTFVIAFQSRPWVGRRTALILQAISVPGAAVLLPFPTSSWPLAAASHLAAFFVTALVCHQALSARKPPKARLTEFYFWISLGGVLGGSFNAFVGPAIFDRIWEYPLVLVLAGLARPWGRGRPPAWLLAVMGVVVVSAIVASLPGPAGQQPGVVVRLALAAACAGAFVLGRRALLFTAALACVFVGAERLSDREGYHHAERSFFGVHRIATQQDRELGPVLTLTNGTTLHGAQATSPTFRCRPLTYYAPATPIGETFGAMQRAQPRLNVGVVGLGAGSVASYGRPGDRMRFFEIDPLVAAMSRPGGWFSFLSQCARSPHDVVLGDARLKLRDEPAGTYDLLVIDAFSSDTVPTHLLTREAIAEYLRLLKPDGLVILHLSNRNLALTPFAAAGARAAGGLPIVRLHYRQAGASQLSESSSEVMAVGRTPASVARLAANGGWSVPPADAPAWTDDRTAVVQALWRRLREGGG